MMIASIECTAWREALLTVTDTKAFRVAITGASELVTSSQGASIKVHFSFADALSRLAEIDVLVSIHTIFKRYSALLSKKEDHIGPWRTS
jgi:hypothetical protein